MKPIAIVIPWFGKNLKGGAEQLAWQVSNRLAGRGYTVEVLTTCCESFLDDWSTNHLPPGVEQNGPLIIRRFKVDKRNGELFNRANTFGLAIPQESLRPGVNPFAFGADEQFVYENINSTSLERYLLRKKKNYKCFIFLPYLYGVVLNGLPLVAEKAYLQPCLHNEVYAYLPQVENCVRLCKGLLYNSIGEESLAHSLFGPGIIRKGAVVGVGVERLDRAKDELPAQIKEIDLLHCKYVLCLGRRDHTKNTSFLVESFRKYKETHPESQLRLVLAGPGKSQFGTDMEHVHDLGLVTEEEKEGLLSNCVALFQPSRNESYSRVIMEAWFYDKPVVAHSSCLATAMAVRAADGGWLADEQADWVQFFYFIENSDTEAFGHKGQKGKEYAQQFAVWDAVLDNYERVLELDSNHEKENVSVFKNRSPRTLHQLTPGFAFGDAISNQAMVIRNILRKKGYKSDIFTEHRDPTMAHEAKLFLDGKAIKADDGLIYHHSIGAGLTDFVLGHEGPKALIYHNITPPDLVRREDPALADKLEQGLRDLKQLAGSFRANAGDSEFNCSELQDNGFNDPGVLPICIEPEKWNIPADAHMMARLQDGKDNILFVGRLVGNKCQHHLIEAFAKYKEFYGNCRLILVGGFIEEEKYYQHLIKQVRVKGLEGDVLFAGKVSESTLHACYRCSHLFWSMSEHEGFGVPLIEAMWFDVPVFAYASSAVPETMGVGGVLFEDKSDLKRLAVTARILIHDTELREKVIRGQQQRRMDFLPEAVEPKLDALIRCIYV